MSTATSTLDPSKFDLHNYAERYEGCSKVARLCFIIEKDPELAASALKLALSELKNGINTTEYLRLFEQYANLAKANSILMDMDWVSNTNANASDSLDRLESELSAVRTAGAKDSIRMSYNDIGHLQYRLGHFSESHKAYAKTKDLCSSPRHTADMCINIIRPNLDSGDLRSVQMYLQKLETVPDLAANISNLLHATRGVMDMYDGQYASASASFLKVNGSNFERYPLCAADVATYGVLCVLATCDRRLIQTGVLQSVPFKKCLESVPLMRQLAQAFIDNSFGVVFALLADVRPSLEMDMYLAPHLMNLYSLITDKIVVGYCSPYNSVDMHKMLVDLKCLSMPELERIVVELICKCQLPFKIDSLTKILCKVTKKIEEDAIASVFQLGEEHNKTMKSNILRLSLVKSQLAPKRRMGRHGPGGAMEFESSLDADYDSDVDMGMEGI